jgi:hypothetical protein
MTAGSSDKEMAICNTQAMVQARCNLDEGCTPVEDNASGMGVADGSSAALPVAATKWCL